MATLNIPLRLIEERKGDKNSLELLGAAIIIKYVYNGSLLRDLSVRGVMSLFGVSHKKALELIEGFRSDSLFSYDEKNNFVMVRTFKSSGVKYFRYHNKQFHAKADYCKKADLSKELKGKVMLREVVRYLRKVLILHLIRVNREGSYYLTVKRSYQPSIAAESPFGLYMPVRRFAEYLRLSPTAVGRIIDEMVQEGMILRTDVAEEYYTAEEYMEKRERTTVDQQAHWVCRNGGFFLCACYGRAYCIKDANLLKSFQHVIYNHHGRLTHNATEQKQDNRLCSEHDEEIEAWEKELALYDR